ncbi:MAG TPA: tripartite tricarboxylate transporter substrate binding protein [Xanthobacteraceae bacterium]|nr:tripartite tricarboxylate transporter substrate binding protein [Xanthobacteraceae bacterium]
MKRACRRVLLLCLILSICPAAASAQAQNYPSHPVRLISDSAPGSAIDVTMRIIAERLSTVWGEQAVVINQPGAGGAIAAHAAAAAVPDGYTLFMPALSAFVALPGKADNLPIVVPRDFSPIGYLGGAPLFITVAPWVGVKTLPDLIALAKKEPGKLAYGANGVGRLTHLTGELLQSRAGIKLLMVPYSGGTTQVLNDMMGGRIALTLDSYSGIAGAVAAGKVRPLAVASLQRVANFPDVPTVAETLPGFAAVGWQVLVAPAGTPDAIVQKANAALLKVTSAADVRERLAQFGREEEAMSPADTLAFIQNEQKTWAPILKQIGRTP